MIADWHDEARALRAERSKLESPMARIAFDNQRAKCIGLPAGLLVLALGQEELENATKQLEEENHAQK